MFVILIFVVFFLKFWLGQATSRTSCPVLAHLHSLSTDGIGVEPFLSCCNDVGVADELDEEEAVCTPFTTIGT